MKIISYCDKSWNIENKNMYQKLNFKFSYNTKPICHFIINKTYKYQKLKIYDSGKIQYEWRREKYENKI